MAKKQHAGLKIEVRVLPGAASDALDAQAEYLSRVLSDAGFEFETLNDFDRITARRGRALLKYTGEVDDPVEAKRRCVLRLVKLCA